MLSELFNFSNLRIKLAGGFNPFRAPQPVLANRRNDAVLTIVQNNDDKTLIIDGVNSPTLKISGYSEEELHGLDFRNLLPADLTETLNDYLEFDVDGNDLSVVLSNVRNFFIIGKDGAYIPLEVKVIRALSNPHSARFQIVLRDNSLYNNLKAGRENYLNNIKGHEVLDKLTHLPNRETIIKDIEMLAFYSAKLHSQACLSLIKLDNFAAISPLGDIKAANVVREIASLCRANIRHEDSIALADTDTLALILLETGAAHAPILLNRLLHIINTTAFSTDNGATNEKVSVQVSISYVEIRPKSQAAKLLDNCEAKLERPSSAVLIAE